MQSVQLFQLLLNYRTFVCWAQSLWKKVNLICVLWTFMLLKYIWEIRKSLYMIHVNIFSHYKPIILVWIWWSGFLIFCPWDEDFCAEEPTSTHHTINHNIWKPGENGKKGKLNICIFCLASDLPTKSAFRPYFPLPIQTILLIEKSV